VSNTRFSASNASFDSRQPLLQLFGLALGYRHGPVVLRVDEQSVHRGEVICLVGPNGGGKTTLLRCAAGLLKPRTGEVRIDGDGVYGRGALSREERARRLAVVLTDSVVAAYFSAVEVVELGRISRPASAAEHGRAIRRALELSGAWGFSQRPLGSLSDGERQRVMLARALAQEPRVLLLDEPAAHLDPPHQTSLFQLLRSLISDGIIEAAVMATHHLHLALHFSDRLMLVDRHIVSAPPAELLGSGALAAAFHADVDLQLDPVKGWFVPKPDGPARGH
jgi:iron complex transport system ATP-binding protein